MKGRLNRRTVAAACIVLAGMVSVASVSAETYEYDELSRVSKVIYEDGSYQTYTYDANGNIKEITSYDASGKKLPQNSGGSSGNGGNQGSGGSSGGGGNQGSGGSSGSGGNQGSGGSSGNGENQGSGNGWQDAADGKLSLQKKINTLIKIVPLWLRDTLRIIQKRLFFLRK